ncbi:PmbA/TldA family metallopeptidase [Saccharopolyspora pogona]|uniref:PmbA/TldA family metallopeptidase n=1 Tax=Saccharopolyspora pogona TaxID=333966 RepID=UPI00168897EA|nr:DNA gyrase modulator [Saccharopolyspora pogona]
MSAANGLIAALPRTATANGPPVSPASPASPVTPSRAHARHVVAPDGRNPASHADFGLDLLGGRCGSTQTEFPHGATELADAALTRSAELGCAHAEFHAMCTRSGSVEVRNAALAATTDQAETGLSVRVPRDGAWGFAAASDVAPESAARR